MTTQVIPISGNYEEMLKRANDLVKAELVPFKNPQDLLLVWQAALDYNIPLASALSSIYVIKGRITVGGHIITGKLLKGGVHIAIINDFVPVTHFVAKGGFKLTLTAEQYLAKSNVYEVVTHDELKAKSYDQTKSPIIKVNPPYIDEDVPDTLTTIRFTRKLMMADGSYSEMIHTSDFYLHQAYQAGFMGKNITNAKDNWYNHTKSMCYMRCLTNGAKRIGADLIHDMIEVSEFADHSNVPYEVDEASEKAAQAIPTIKIK
jgi:hypothetical protein